MLVVRKATVNHERLLYGGESRATTFRFWPNSAGDISLWAGGTADTNAADDENKLCDNSRRQAILQASIPRGRMDHASMC
jgi:hypothetical protein